MKRNIFLIIGVFICVIGSGQTLEEQILQEEWHTLSSSNVNAGKWTRIATCTNYGRYVDFGVVFNLFGNGSGNQNFYYGKLIARFKRQNAEQGPATHMALLLMDSNIGTDNIKAVRNNATIDIYIRVNSEYTRFYFKREIKGGSLVTALNDEPFFEELPAGDLIIDCKSESSG